MIEGKNVTRKIQRSFPVFPIVISSMVLSSVLFAADRQQKTEAEIPAAQTAVLDTVNLADSNQVDLDCSADRLPTGYQVAKSQEGHVTYYGRIHNGARTASGELHHSTQLVAAHRSLPFGTRVRVSTKDGKTVVVRINDRGPFVRGRELDISYSAARQLGMLKKGVIPARIEILKETSPEVLALSDSGECSLN